MLNFISNIPLVIGLAFRNLSDYLFNFSFKLHMLFKTEVGIKLSELNKAFDDLKTNIKNNKNPSNENRKLVNILKDNRQPNFTANKK